jgi:hypothetical protein
MRTALALFLCLPLLAPPGLCACGAGTASPAASKCGCCKVSRKKCPAKSDRVAGQPQPHGNHAPACPAHPTANVRLVKAGTPGFTVAAPAVAPLTIAVPPVYVSRPPDPADDSQSDPPLYLNALRC